MSFNNIQYQTSTHPHESFDLSHDTLTSCGFGEVQPTSVRLLPTVGKSKIQTSALVRLAPLVSPTWGRMWFHQYHQFVAIEDIFWQFPHFLSNIKALNNPVQGSLNSVKTLPCVTMGVLTEQLMRRGMCNITCYEGSTDSLGETTWVPTSTGGDKGLYSTIPHVTGDWAGVGTSSRWPVSQTDNTLSDFVTPDNADFQPITNLNNSGNDYRMCIRLTNRGMRFYKLLLGCGYKPLWNTDSYTYVSLLPLMASYKAYWDIFRLPQYDNWESTALYRLIKWYDVHGVTPLDYTSPDSANMLVLQGILDDFVDECLEMFYTANQDFVSAHESVDSLTSTTRGEHNQELDSVRYTPNGTLGSSTYASPRFNISTGANSVITLAGGYFGQLDIELLKKMYYWTNKSTKIGYDIAEVLKAKGLGQFVEENKEKSNFIGSSRSPIKVNELLNTAETEGITADTGAHLGDYAGQSSQYDESKVFTYHNNQIGYVVSLCCVVPEPRQSMAMDPTLLAVSSDGSSGNLTEFYNPMFDGFGLEFTPLMCIGHENYVSRNTDTQSERTTFGQIPRYTGFKIGQNIRSGMFASLANLDTFAPFHLDKMILKGGKFRRHAYKQGTGVTPGTFVDSLAYDGSAEDLMPLAGRNWRFPTRIGGIGNYDRIFYNSGKIGSLDGRYAGIPNFDYEPANDNFLIFMSYKHNASLAMLPLSRSWDTIDDEGGENNADGTANARQ